MVSVVEASGDEDLKGLIEEFGPALLFFLGNGGEEGVGADWDDDRPDRVGHRKALNDVVSRDEAAMEHRGEHDENIEDSFRFDVARDDIAGEDVDRHADARGHDDIDDRVEVAEVTDNVGVEPEYLSHLFKQELKTTVSKYIVNRKIVESKKLLRFSTASLSEIASMLCFSSQSHFQNHFKKIRGITPNQYRELYLSTKSEL